MNIHFFSSIVQNLSIEKNTHDLKKNFFALNKQKFSFSYHSNHKVKQHQAMENNQHLKHDQVSIENKYVLEDYYFQDHMQDMHLFEHRI